MRINGKNISTIVSDFDGTILKKGEWEPSQLFFQVIEDIMKRGYKFVAASGRQYANLHEMLQRLGDDVIYICENGCLVVYRGEILHKEIIHEKLAKELLDDLQKQGEDTDITVSVENTCYMVPTQTGFMDIMKNVIKFHVTEVASFEEVQEEPMKISIHFKDEIPERVVKQFREKYGDRLQIVDAGNHFLDFNPLGSGKGEALKILSEKMGFRLEECMAFGDSENDINLLKTSGVSFAMEGAKPYVKAEAHYICENVEEVIDYLVQEEVKLEEWVCNLALSAGKDEEQAKEFWENLKKDKEILEELVYYAENNEFLCKYEVAGYTVTDILVWQVDHFKAYLDRHDEVNRYRQDRLLYNSFEILLKMRENPSLYVRKLQGETGTDFESKY